MYGAWGIYRFFDEDRIAEKLKDDYGALVSLIEEERLNLAKLKPEHEIFELDKNLPYFLAFLPRIDVLQAYYVDLRETVTQELRTRLKKEGLFEKVRNNHCITDENLEQRLKQMGILNMVRTHHGTIYHNH